jgi:hypothetical protein
MLFVFICIYWYSTRFPYQLMFVLCISKTTGEAGTANPYGASEFIPGFNGSSCCSIFSFWCNVLLIVVCPFFIWSLCCCLSFELRLLIIPLVSSSYPLTSNHMPNTNDVASRRNTNLKCFIHLLMLGGFKCRKLICSVNYVGSHNKVDTNNLKLNSAGDWLPFLIFD